jgi:ketosteroid isomerase-like protein
VSGAERLETEFCFLFTAARLRDERPRRQNVTTMRRILLIVAFVMISASSGAGFVITVQAADHSKPAGRPAAFADNVQTTEALLTALEHKDLEAIVGRLAPEVVLVLPLAPDGDNDPRNVDRFEGREAVRSALWRNFVAYKRIAFVNKVITPSADGRVIFVEAQGQFETVHGRPYHNVYLIKVVFNEAGAVTRIEEWTNPVTASMTWGFPLGSAAVPRFTAVGLAITVGVVSGVFVFLLRRPRWPSQVGKAV